MHLHCTCNVCCSLLCFDSKVRPRKLCTSSVTASRIISLVILAKSFHSDIAENFPVMDCIVNMQMQLNIIPASWAKSIMGQKHHGSKVSHARSMQMCSACAQVQ